MSKSSRRWKTAAAEYSLLRPDMTMRIANNPRPHLLLAGQPVRKLFESSATSKP